MSAFQSSTDQQGSEPWRIRGDIIVAYQEYWKTLARPGNWWTGAERVAIAQETRNAVTCAYCAERKQALSPYNFPGEHEHSGALDLRVVDAVHRVITDQGRITQRWIDENAEAGLTDAHYIELVGIAVTVFSIDEFYHALGLPPEPLPEPMAGEPDGYRPPQATKDIGYVAMLPEKGGAVGKEADLWADGRTANVWRALSLVPDAVRDWVKIGDAQYLPIQVGADFEANGGRAIDRMQIELVAARVASHNECFY